MKAVRLTAGEARSAFRELLRSYRIIAPVEKVEGGRLSGAGLLAYDEVTGIEDINFHEKTLYSAKSVLLPVRETLFQFKNKRMEETGEEFLPTLLFLRACDIHALSVMDKHFLENGGCADPYYKRRRQRTKLVLMECAQSFDNCFCVSLGTNQTSAYALFIRKTGTGYEAQVRDGELESYFSGGEIAEVEPRFVETDSATLKRPRQVDDALFEHEMWKEYSSRCIACGRCTVCCPTCMCFTMQDLPAEGKEETGKRRRIWSSCQVKDFGLLAGGHDFRIPHGDRMRYRVLHKMHDFEQRTGVSMCVGCGRCDDICPEYISLLRCVEKIGLITPEPAGN